MSGILDGEGKKTEKNFSRAFRTREQVFLSLCAYFLLKGPPNSHPDLLPRFLVRIEG